MRHYKRYSNTERKRLLKKIEQVDEIVGKTKDSELAKRLNVTPNALSDFRRKYDSQTYKTAEKLEIRVDEFLEKHPNEAWPQKTDRLFTPSYVEKKTTQKNTQYRSDISAYTSQELADELKHRGYTIKAIKEL